METYRWLVILMSAGAVLSAVAAPLIIQIIRQITAWQLVPRWQLVAR